MKFKKMLIFIIMTLLFTSCESGFEDMMDETKAVENSVSYNDNGATGGSIPVDNTIYRTGDTVTVLLNSGSLKKIPTAGTGEAFKFGGWNTKADGSGISYTAGSGTFVFDTAIVLYAEWVKFELRDRGPANGWIFYDKGSYSGGWRYLEAAPADAGTLQWLSTDTFLNGTSVAGGETEEGIGTGAYNTNRILHYKAARTAPAAEYYDGLEVNGYSDWFLPSRYELNAMYADLHQHGVGGFVNVAYWSSSESHEWGAWNHNFGSGSQGGSSKSESRRVRAVRRF